MVEYWKNLITSSWTIYKNNFTLFLTYAILTLIISAVALFSTNNLVNNTVLYLIFAIGYELVSWGLFLGILKIIYDLLATNGYHPNIQDIIIGFNYLLKFILPFCLIIIPAVMISTLLSGSESAVWPLGIVLIIGVIGLVIALFFYPIIIIKDSLSIRDAVQKSLAMIKQNFGTVSQFILLLILTVFLVQFILASFFMLIGLGDFSSLNATPSLTAIATPQLWASLLATLCFYHTKAKPS